MAFTPRAREWLGRSIEITPMKGATSSSVYLIRCSDSTRSRRYVLRVLDNAEWMANEPNLSAHEATALEEAERAGLRAPRLVAHAPNDVGFGAPVVLMSFVEGRVELRPSNFQKWLEGLAGELALIHRHRAEAFPWRFRSWVQKSALTVPAWAKNPGVWERAIALALGPQPDGEPVFLHRDYHPTNVLWDKGAVSGVVDWVNACRGPAGVDVGHCRMNLAMMLGPVAAEPTFYAPWQEFGLNVIGQEVLQHRVEAYLESVMMRT